jgi:nicotinate-nucleotide adenylyltransferase
LPRPSFTIDTLTHLREVYESYTFSLIMGADNLQYLHRWKNYEALLKYYPIYVYPRANSELEAGKVYPQVQHFDAPLLNISATYIRRLVQNDKSIHFTVPTAVQEYIETEALFR